MTQMHNTICVNLLDMSLKAIISLQQNQPASHMMVSAPPMLATAATTWSAYPVEIPLTITETFPQQDVVEENTLKYLYTINKLRIITSHVLKRIKMIKYMLYPLLTFTDILQ